ncbi:MAG: TonB-dependent receptor [Caulobacterales bacterium]
MKVSRLLLSLSCATGAIVGWGSQASAQEATSDEIIVTATGRSAALQDVPVAVTALSGEELQNAGVRSIADLNTVAPSLRIGAGQSTTSGTIAYIRGIGTGSDNPGFESAVGFFIDGVYRARPGSALSDFPEVTRVEVLRGPQGTLYGKNTSAGAISVVTAGPQQDFGVWGEVGAGERSALNTKFGLTGGVTDNLALRFDASVRQQDGYITDVVSGNDINSTDRWSARGQVRWDISDNASLRVILDGGSTDEACCGAVTLQRGTIIGALASSYFPGAILPPDLEARQMTVTPGRSYSEQTDELGISGELTWDLGFANLTSITAYRDWQSDRKQDVDFSSIDRAYRAGLEIEFKNFSQELRLQGEAGRLNWLVGGFYADEQLDTTDRIRFGRDALNFTNAATFFLTGGVYDLYTTTTPGANGANCLTQGPGGSFIGAGGYCLTDIQAGDGQVADNWNVDTRSLALFTHNEIELTDAMTWTIGLRFNHETKDLSANLLSQNAACAQLQNNVFTAGPFTGQNIAATIAAANSAAPVLFALACNAVTNTLANGTYAADREENEWSGTTSLSFHLNDDNLLYGGYSRGYKAGGYNVDRSAFFGPTNQSAYDPTPVRISALEFSPEFTDAFEVGLKSTLFGGSTTLNTAVFYEQIHDYQLNAFSGFNFFTRNIAEVVTQGVEIELAARPTDRLTLGGSVMYTDAYYNATTQLGGDTLREGTRMDQIPEWTVTGNIGYSQPIGAGLAINAYLDGRWMSDYPVMSIGRNPITDNESFAIFNARLGIGAESGRWAFDIFVRNLTDEFYFVDAFGAPERTLPSSVDPTGAGSNYNAYPNEPRTIGATLRARF